MRLLLSPKYRLPPLRNRLSRRATSLGTAFATAVLHDWYREASGPPKCVPPRIVHRHVAMKEQEQEQKMRDVKQKGGIRDIRMGVSLTACGGAWHTMRQTSLFALC